MSLQNRVVRYGDAPAYLGMDKNRFNAEVRPLLVEVPIGTIGIGFDRLDLDAWFDNYKALHGRKNKKQGDKQCQKSKQDSPSAARTGTSIKSSKVTDFTKALAQATSKKQSVT